MATQEVHDSKPVKISCTNNVIQLEEIKLSPQRFLMLAIFSCGAFMNAFPFCQYSIISDVITEYYSVSALAINWTTTIFMIGFIIGSYPGIWIFQKKGIRTGILIGLVGTTLGYWVKCAALPRNLFWVAMFGQLLISLCQAFFLTVPPFLASKWFGANEVSRACSIGVLSNTAGAALGSVVPPLVITSTDPVKQFMQLSYMTFAQACVCTIVTVVALIAFREKPLHPPSMAQAKLRYDENEKQDNGPSISLIFKDIKTLITNINFVLVAIAYGIYYGLGATLLTVLNQMLLPIYPTASKDVGVLGLLFLMTGSIGMIIMGVLLDKTHKYKEVALVTFTCGTIGISAFTLVIQSSLLAVYVTVTFCGFFIASFISFGLELGIEMTYPLPEMTSSMMFGCVANIVTMLMIHVCGWALTDYGRLAANTILVVLSTIGFIFIAVSKVELRRAAANETKNESLENGISK